MPNDQRSQYTMRSMQTDLGALKGAGPAEKSVMVDQPAHKPAPAPQMAPPPNLPHVQESPERPAAPVAPQKTLQPRPQQSPQASAPSIAVRNFMAEPARPAALPPIHNRPRAAVPPPPTPTPKPPVSALKPRATEGKKVPILIGGALLIMLLIGAEVWWFFIRPDAVEPIIKPTTDGLTRPEDTLPTGLNEPPQPQGEQPAVAEPLLAYAETETITLPSSETAQVVSALNSAVTKTRTAGRPSRLVFLVPQGNSQRELTWTELSTALQFSVPASVQAQLAGSYNIFVMPKTAFDTATCDEANGGSDCAGPRLGLALSAKDSAALQSSVRAWEETMVQDLRHLIVANISGATRPFLDASYRGSSVRYRNLPHPTVTIDYALVQKKLIITTSKSLMFATLDSQ